ncbi:hypothetical protein C7S13_5453 [Burkholderia cepacia]|nr:hypothetical protein [Burkholderia cepacia]
MHGGAAQAAVPNDGRQRPVWRIGACDASVTKCHERDYNAATGADERCLSDDSRRAASDARRTRAN